MSTELGVDQRPRSDCQHCGLPLGSFEVQGFCCNGCRHAHALIDELGLGRYYDLRDGPGRAAGDARPEQGDFKWLDQYASEDGTLACAVGGLDCSACVWLIESLFRRIDGAQTIEINVVRGTMHLTFAEHFDAKRFFADVTACGYQIGPPRTVFAADPMSARVGPAIALAGNAMLLSVALYAGLVDEPLYTLFHWLIFLLSSAVVVIGGPVFFRAAWVSLTRGALHFELPIGLGIAGAYLGSLYAFASGDWDYLYFDTVAIFVALMLVGRMVRARAVERTVAHILDDAGLEGLLCRVVDGPAVRTTPAMAICEGDEMLLGPGDVLPVDAALTDDSATVSREWITGEPTEHRVATGDTAPAGACVTGQRTSRWRANQPFSDSPLIALLTQPARDTTSASNYWTRAGRWYTSTVLTLCTLGFLGWWLAAHDLHRAISVAIAILVVTCPCAVGLATPLCYELLHSRLRARGLLVRSSSLLERIGRTRRIIFDKTGTLTLPNAAALPDDHELTPDEQLILFNLAVRSSHPRSEAVRTALQEQKHSRFSADLAVVEVPGCGMETTVSGVSYRLGSADWAAGAEASAGLVFSVDRRLRAKLADGETLRPETAAHIEWLTGAGLEIWIASGDAPSRVQAIASKLGIPKAHAIGGLAPNGKRDLVCKLDRGDTLVLGDGLNDLPALSAAPISGTTAATRPMVAARSDFCVTTPGLGPIRDLFSAGHTLRITVRRNLWFALLYNGTAVALAASGLLTPLACAIAMPLSSLSAIALTLWSVARSTPPLSIGAQKPGSSSIATQQPQRQGPLGPNSTSSVRLTVTD